jgi:glycosyltransferase involved in cell wall biosynthesis
VESGINKRLKVVWLCHFANQEMFQYFNKSEGKEFAPWISLMIKLFKAEKSIELHIVAPNVYTNKDKSFIKDGIYYHFYKYIPIIPVFNKYFRKIYYTLKIEQFSDCYWIKKKVPRIINKIKPDIINLHGAENPYYSSGILPLIGKYPLLTSIQGFIRQSSYKSMEVTQRIRIEENIIKKCKHFGTRTEDMNNVVLDINPNAKLYYHAYPLKIPTVFKNNIGGDEPIDCVFFARVTKDKGIEDLLEAIALIKLKKPKINLHVIGSVTNTYLGFLKNKCINLKIKENVNFVGFMKTQEDIYNYLLKAKVYVIPTYHDVIPGTLLESMYIKLPSVSYAVGGIPDINDKLERIKLVEKLNIKELAHSIISLLDNPVIRKELSDEAFLWVKNKFNNKNIVSELTTAYNCVLTKNDK